MESKYKKEIARLASLCLAHDIPFETAPLYDGWIIAYPTLKDRVSDAVCHGFSYGHEAGLLEIMGLVDGRKSHGDPVEGFLVAEEVFERWHMHWLRTHAEEDT